MKNASLKNRTLCLNKTLIPFDIFTKQLIVYVACIQFRAYFWEFVKRFFKKILELNS